jgi:hypothetical protein
MYENVCGLKLGVEFKENENVVAMDLAENTAKKQPA